MNFYSKRWGRVALLMMVLGVLALGLTTSGLINTAQAAEIRQENFSKYKSWLEVIPRIGNRLGAYPQPISTPC